MEKELFFISKMTSMRRAAKKASKDVEVSATGNESSMALNNAEEHLILRDGTMTAINSINRKLNPCAIPKPSNTHGSTHQISLTQEFCWGSPFRIDSLSNPESFNSKYPSHQESVSLDDQSTHDLSFESESSLKVSGSNSPRTVE